MRVPGDALLECPSCGLPAEISDRFTLDGVPTAVAHVKLICVLGHWYTLPVDQLSRWTEGDANHRHDDALGYPPDAVSPETPM